MTTATAIAGILSRAQRTEQALFRGAPLNMSNPHYCEFVHGLLDQLSAADAKPRDLTVDALRFASSHCTAGIVACEAGVAAGLEEFEFLISSSHLRIQVLVADGQSFEKDEVLARIEGDETRLLAIERVGLNLLQRMCGIATAARRLQERVKMRNPECRVVGTRKTPWGLLDKRAVHLGGAGTHRISLSDAILIKNNHLAVIARTETEAAPIAVERAWSSRGESAFIEVEVRGAEAAVAAAETFRHLREKDDPHYACLLMLDNLAPAKIAQIIAGLQSRKLHDQVLIEASGGITDENIEDYAASGVDAISVGAITHSPRALDIAQRIS